MARGSHHSSTTIARIVCSRERASVPEKRQIDAERADAEILVDARVV